MNRSPFKQFIRIFDINLNGYENIIMSMKKIKGINIRFSHIIVKKSSCINNIKTGYLCKTKIEKLINIIINPKTFKIPEWLFNRKKDKDSAENHHVVSSVLTRVLRNDIVSLQKTKANRGIRHLKNLKTRGQHTKSNGRKGNTLGVMRKKKKNNNSFLTLITTQTI